MIYLAFNLLQFGLAFTISASVFFLLVTKPWKKKVVVPPVDQQWPIMKTPIEQRFNEGYTVGVDLHEPNNCAFSLVHSYTTRKQMDNSAFVWNRNFTVVLVKKGLTMDECLDQVNMCHKLFHATIVYERISGNVIRHETKYDKSS